MNSFTKLNGSRYKRSLEGAKNEAKVVKRSKSDGSILIKGEIDQDYFNNACAKLKSKQLTSPLNLKCICLNTFRVNNLHCKPIPMDKASDPSSFREFFDLEFLKIISEVLKQPGEMEQSFSLLPHLISHLNSSSDMLKMQAVNGITNITWLPLEIIDLFLNNNVFSYLFEVLEKTNEVDVMRRITKFYFILLKQISDLPRRLIPWLLSSMLGALKLEDCEILGNITAILYFLTDSFNGSFVELIAYNYIRTVVKLLSHSDFRVSRNALSIIVNYVRFANKNELAYILNCNILPSIPGLLKRSYVRINALKVVVSYAKMNKCYIQQIIDSGILKITLGLMRYDNVDVRKMIVLVLKAFNEKGTCEQVHYVIKIGVIQALIQILNSKESTLMKLTLITFKSFFNKSKNDATLMRAILSSCEGLQEILKDLKEQAIGSDLRFEAVNVEYLYVSAKFSLKM